MSWNISVRSGATRSCLLLTLLLGLCFVRVDASIAFELREWHDPLFGKDWRLEPIGDEVLVHFAATASAVERDAVSSAEGLTEVHAWDARYGTAVFRVRAGEEANEVAERLKSSPSIQGAAPVVRDAEGFRKYYVPGQLLLQFDRTLSDAACRGRLAAARSEVLEDYWTPGFYRVALPPSADLFATLRSWVADSAIEFAEPAYMCYDDAAFVPNDTFFMQQWALRNTGQQSGWTPGADIQAPEAWDFSAGDPAIVIAVIDSGMDLTHEDLAANLLPRNGADWDFANADFSPDDDDQHGTACAGIAVAVQNNSRGVSGAAPQCSVMPLKVDLTSGMNANRADAINYAASRRAEFIGLILSCSWVMSSGDFTAVQAAIANADAADCVICFAAGNDNGAVSYPARYSETICVGATSPCDERKSPTSCDNNATWGSNFGPEMDVVAPGAKIHSTDRTGAPGYSAGNYVVSFNGTSASVPFVAGICGLIYSINPTLSNDGVRAILEASCEDQVGNSSEDVPGWDPYMGWGRINANLALQLASIPESFEDDVELGGTSWTHGSASPGWVDEWHLSQARNHTPGGTTSWHAGSSTGGDYSQHVNAALVTPIVRLGEGDHLSFWHHMNAVELSAESAADGGVIEASTDGGASWTQVTPENGYTHTWTAATSLPFTQGTPVFSGHFADWRPEFVDLSAFANQSVQIRFRFGTRELIPPMNADEGWYIDDVDLGPVDPAAVGEGDVRLRPEVLEANPNPFLTSTVIRYRLPEAAEVTYSIVDAAGRTVLQAPRRLADAGDHRVFFDGRDGDGRLVPAGVYFLRLDAGGQALTRRLIRLH